MNPKKIPFTDAYVKDQQSSLSVGGTILMVVGIAVVVVGIALSIRSRSDYMGYLTLGMVYLVWAGLAKQRLNTFRENLELHRMIQELREDKDG